MNTVILQKDSILQVPIDSYQKDFTFIVNNEKFQTTKLIADLLSSKISKIHQTDPTLDTFKIYTKNKGNFANILQLANFNQFALPDNEIQFIDEIIRILEIEKITINIYSPKITFKNVFELIQKHEKNYNSLYLSNLTEEIDFLSENFYQLTDDQKESLFKLPDEAIESIINNEKLTLNTEDQLKDFIDKICEENDRFSFLYEYVYFENISKENFAKFIDDFDINFMTRSIWNSLSRRFLDLKNENKKRKYKSQKDYIEIQYDSNKLKGILNYLQNNSNIYDEVNIKPSSFGGGDIKNLLNFEYSHKGFYTKNIPQSSICFQFKKRKIIPKGYLIKSQHNQSNYTHLKSWVIEGSTDSYNWKILDQQKNCQLLNGSFFVHYFPIDNSDNDEFNYLRIRQTAPGWDQSYYLHISAIEFFGDFSSST